MSTNTQCYVLAGPDPEDIVDALAIICGARVKAVEISCGNGSFSAYQVQGRPYKIKSHLLFWGEIVLNLPKPMAEEFHLSMWFPQYRGGEFYWTLSSLSTAYAIAVFKRLVDFFGGEVVYQESGEESHISHGIVKRRVGGKPPDDGPQYEKYQMQFLKLKAPRYQELQDADEQARYKQEDRN